MSASVSASPSPSLNHRDQRGGADGNDYDDVVGGAFTSSNPIEQSALLDITFLHSIATHRPIGTHKHFNVIPVLINLDRTARQIGARLRDNKVIIPDNRDKDIDEDESARPRKAIKREEGGGGADEEVVMMMEEEKDAGGMQRNGDIAETAMTIEAEMVWNRFDQLYDLEGLEELEEQAMEGETSSPFHDIHGNLASRNRAQGASTSKIIPFGFGSGLSKTKKAAATSSSSKSAAQSSSGRGNRTKSAAGAIDEAIVEEEQSMQDQQVEFELGPWEEYEDLIAPRRLKSYANDEEREQEGVSESDDEELSEPSEASAEAVSSSKTKGKAQDEKADAGSEVDGAETMEDEEAAGERGEEDVEEEEEEEAESKTSKRKTHSRRPSTISKRASTGSNIATGVTAASTPSSKNTRNTAKPRRSARR